MFKRINFMFTYKIVNEDVSVKNGDYYFQIETTFTVFGYEVYKNLKDVRCYSHPAVGYLLTDLKTGKNSFFNLYSREIAIEAQLNKLGFSTK